MKALATLVVALGALQDAPKAAAPQGLAVERTVRSTSIDWLGRKREVQRKESILLRGSNLVVNDLTYGEKLIIRTDLKKVWKADPLGGRYSEYTFDEVASIRKAALDELRSVKARIAGTKDEKELDDLLEGYDQFAAAPKVELKSTGAARELTVNDAFVRLSADVDPKLPADGFVEALGAIGAFHPAVAEKLKSLGGLPVKGKIRYVLFMDRMIDEFEVTSSAAREIADAEFELPKGLVQAPLPGFGRPPERKPARPAIAPRDFKDEDK